MLGQIVRVGVTVACVAATTLCGAPPVIAESEPSRDSADKPAATQPSDADPQGSEQHPEKRDEQQQDHWQRGKRFIRTALLKEIDLTDEQQTKIDAAFTGHYEKLRTWFKEHREQIHNLKHQMRELHEANDTEKIAGLRDQAHALFESRPDLTDLGESIQDTLTDAQWQQFQENRETLRRRIAEHLRDRGWKEETGDDQHALAATQPGGSIRHIRQAIKMLDLTDEQKNKLETYFKERPQRIEQNRQWEEEHRDELKRLRDQMRAAREAEDQEKLQDLREQQRELMKDKPLQSLTATLQSILTDEQMQQLEQEARKQLHRRSDNRNNGDEDNGDDD